MKLLAFSGWLVAALLAARVRSERRCYPTPDELEAMSWQRREAYFTYIGLVEGTEAAIAASDRRRAARPFALGNGRYPETGYVDPYLDSLHQHGGRS